jgi:cyclase
LKTITDRPVRFIINTHFHGDHTGDNDIRALYFPAGHTDGDSIICFAHSNVAHMGGDFVAYGFPFIDVESGGINGMIDAVQQVVSQLPPDDKVIPGQGPVSNFDDGRAYLGMLMETRDAVQKALKEGKTLDQMKQAKLLAPWKKYSGDFVNEDTFLETLYNSLTGQTTGKFIKHN